jgi:hypothetical protein
MNELVAEYKRETCSGIFRVHPEYLKELEDAQND